jgi:hypothetical protein
MLSKLWLQVTWTGGKNTYQHCNLWDRGFAEYEGECVEATQYNPRASDEEDYTCLPESNGGQRLGLQCTRQVCSSLEPGVPHPHLV